MSEHQIGEIWTDAVDGLKVITVRDTGKDGCKACAFSTFAGGACPGAVYDRHPCCASDRSDDKGVFFRLVCYVPELKYKPKKTPKTFFGSSLGGLLQ